MSNTPENKEKEEEKPVVAKNAIDLQRLKLQKLMKNPEKPIILPERPKAKSTPTVPEFVRNVMGSSAGAGSGEFHVYRHLRRKEYARQKFIQEKGHKELLDAEYHKKLEENKRIAEEITAKKRAKRQKKKKWKDKKKIKLTDNQPKKIEELLSSDDDDLEKEDVDSKTDNETNKNDNESVVVPDRNDNESNVVTDKNNTESEVIVSKNDVTSEIVTDKNATKLEVNSSAENNVSQSETKAETCENTDKECINQNQLHLESNPDAGEKSVDDSTS